MLSKFKYICIWAVELRTASFQFFSADTAQKKEKLLLTGGVPKSAAHAIYEFMALYIYIYLFIYICIWILM
jgi:hypothetical protein